MNKLSVVFALGLPLTLFAFGSACTPAASPGGENDDSGVEILDSGFDRDGGTPNPESDGGTPPADAGSPEGDAGPPPTDGGILPPLDGGGFVLDGGLVEYSGEAELGVRCGNPLTTCAAGAPCCVSVDFSTLDLAGECGDVPAQGDPQTCPSFAMGCDDRQQDCAGDDVCCFALDIQIPPVMFSRCMPTAECAAIDVDPAQPDATETCVATADCPGTQLCCGADLGSFTVPFDVGVCRDDCEL